MRFGDTKSVRQLAGEHFVQQPEGGSVRRGSWVVIMCAVVTSLLLFAAWYPYTSGGRQRYNLARAEEHLPKVQAIINSDPRLKEVKIGVYTGQDGAVGLFGRVESPGDLFRLMRAVAAERLPVAVHWQVQVLSEEDGP